MSEYLLIALGFWLGAAMVNYDGLFKQELPSYFLGVVGCLFWPVMLFMTWLDHRDRSRP